MVDRHVFRQWMAIMTLNPKNGICFNKVARLASMIDMGILLMCYLAFSPFTDNLRLVSYFFAVLVLFAYVVFDFFFFHELRSSLNYYPVLAFCILSAVSCLFNFSFDLHLREIVRLALDVYVFYLVPSTWSAIERNKMVRFTFDSLYVILSVIISVLFLLALVIVFYGYFSIAASEFYISLDARLYCGLNPNTTGSVALLTIVLCAHRFLAKKKIGIDSIVVVLMALLLLLLSQSRTALISVIVFFSVFFFFKMLIGSNYSVRRALILFVITCFLAVAIFFVFTIAIEMLYNFLYRFGFVEVGNISVGDLPLIKDNSLQRLASVDYSLSGRSDIWMEAIHAILENPLWGCDYVAIKSNGGELGYHTGYAHNLLLQIALYCGIPCALIALYIVFSYIVGFAKNTKKTLFDVLLFSSVFALSCEFMAESLILSLLPICYFTSLGSGAYYNKHRETQSDGNNILHNTSL